jgi:tetratricopeptide (TPR) repeat protein
MRRMRFKAVAIGRGVWLVAGVALAVVDCRQSPPPANTNTNAVASAPANPEAAARQAADELRKGQYRQGLARLDGLHDQALSKDVQALVDRVRAAVAKAQEANALFQKGEHDKAAQLMDEAAQQYPEAAELRMGADYFAGYVAFDRKDYDQYLRLAEASLPRAPDNMLVVFWVANALAAKFAVTGDASYRKRAEEVLAKAHTMTPADPEAQAGYEKIAARIRYRMDSREIIPQEEYERRLASGKAPRPRSAGN